MDYTLVCETGKFGLKEIDIPQPDVNRDKIRKCNIQTECWVCERDDFPCVNFTPKFKGINICESCLEHALALSLFVEE
jgi:hypothetical protein